MNITAVRYYNVHDLVARLRKVTMLQDKNTLPYKNADIQVTDIATAQLSPAQLYIIRPEFEKVRDLRWALLARNIDILRLGQARMLDGVLTDQAGAGQPVGFIEFDLCTDKVEGATKTITVLPPIVEVQEEADRSKHNLINDGMHRCYLARVSRVIPAVVRIEGIPRDLPYYAYPTPNGWMDVHMVDSLSPKILKKHHRFPDYKRYYRNFNSAFENVGGPRGDGKPTTKKERATT